MYGMKLVNMCHGSKDSILETKYTVTNFSEQFYGAKTDERTAVCADEAEYHDAICTITLP